MTKRMRGNVTDEQSEIMKKRSITLQYIINNYFDNIVFNNQLNTNEIEFEIERTKTLMGNQKEIIKMLKKQYEETQKNKDAVYKQYISKIDKIEKNHETKVKALEEKYNKELNSENKDYKYTKDFVEETYSKHDKLFIKELKNIDENIQLLEQKFLKTRSVKEKYENFLKNKDNIISKYNQEINSNIDDALDELYDILDHNYDQRRRIATPRISQNVVKKIAKKYHLKPKQLNSGIQEFPDFIRECLEDYEKYGTRKKTYDIINKENNNIISKHDKLVLKGN